MTWMSEVEDLREFIRRQSEEMRRHHDRQDRKIDDLIAESQAQRAALFRMMDRLDNGGTAPAA
jgi:hypothetical protein